MKKLLILLAFSAVLSISALAQSNAPLTVQEIDGSPRGTNISVIKVSNGSLTISGHTATIVTGGGGGGGCTPPGTASRVLYDDGAGGCTSTSGLTATATIATMTNGRFVTAINDSAGNELIKLTATGSAVNEITLANAATGNNPTITASGGDSDVGFNFLVKGAGVYRFLASASGPSDFRLFEDADNGSNYVSLIPAASLASDFVLTLPSATDTLVGKATTDTLTNKTYDTAGTGNAFKINGTAITAISGNTATVATTSGALTSGNCAKFDASGNIVDNGAVCGGSGGTPGGSDTQLQYNNAGSFGGISGATTNGTSVTLTSPTVNTGITLNAAPLTMSGNITAAAWTTGGIRIKGSAATLTDTTSSGTVAAAYTNALGGNTIAASSLTTFTNYYSTFLNAPTAGSNVTLTNAWALGLSGGQQVIRNSLGTTNATGIELVNNTAAAAGAQQISPDVIWTGQGWKTTATAASQTVNWKAYLLPVQGTANPNSVLAFTPQINGAGYSSNALLQLRTVDISAASSGSVVISALSPNTQALTITPRGLNGSGSIQTNTNNGVAIQEASTTGTSASIAQLSLIATTSATPAAGFGPSLVYASKTNGNSQRTIGYIANVFTDATDATRTSAYDFQLVNSGTLGIAARLAPGSLRMGDADAASPVAQTLSVQGGTGTNTSGVTWTHQASLGTSQGVPGRHSFTNGALIAASGTTTQTPVSRLELGATKVLANNTTTTIVNVTDASNTVAAGFVEYAVEVFDGTDLQVETGSFTYQVTNKGGTIANNTITFAGASGVGVTSNYPKNTTTSGTLAVTWAISAANPALLSVNANSSLTPSTGYPRVTYSIRNLTQQAIAVQ